MSHKTGLDCGLPCCHWVAKVYTYGSSAAFWLLILLVSGLIGMSVIGSLSTKEITERNQALRKELKVAKNKKQEIKVIEKVKIIQKKVPVPVVQTKVITRTQIVKSSGSQKAAMALPRQDNINYCELYRIKISPCPYRSPAEAEAYLQGLNKNKKPAMRDYLY